MGAALAALTTWAERRVTSWAGRGTCLAHEALDQKNSTIKLPSIVPVNSISQSKGLSPNGRSFWAKHAIITVTPTSLIRIKAGSCLSRCSVRITPQEK
jgi:hypothetical protein